MEQPLLTIVIPTYNRAIYLDKCLASIITQINNDGVIELIVANNASTDNTHEIVEKYLLNSNCAIKYINRPENIGPDNNFANCFNEAKGKYFWIIGDDDFLLPNKLDKIIAVLNEVDYGIVFLKGSISYNSEEELDKIDASNKGGLLDKKTFNSSIEFYREYSFWATFITGSIVNRGLLVQQPFDPYRFANTCLIQLGWTITATFATPINTIVYTPIVACKANNTGGYGLMTIFSKNYNFILKDFIKRGYDKQIISITNVDLLKGFFPHFLIKLLYDKNDFKKEHHFSIITKNNWVYKQYWKGIFPIYINFYVKKTFPFLKKTKYYLKLLMIKTAIKKLKIWLYAKTRFTNLENLIKNEEQTILKKQFQNIDKNSCLPLNSQIKNPQYISIGENFHSLQNLRIEAWDEYANQKFLPEIIIGNNVCFNTDVHIGCINKVVIGDNVLLASRIFISDHSHGDISSEALALPPIQRQLVSKGPVIIEDNVWIGEGVSILANVTIGKNSIVGTNAVVTKSFAANSVIAGNPARLIRTL